MKASKTLRSLDDIGSFSVISIALYSTYMKISVDLELLTRGRGVDPQCRGISDYRERFEFALEKLRHWKSGRSLRWAELQYHQLVANPIVFWNFYYYPLAMTKI